MMAQDGAKIVQDCPRWPQEAPQTLQLVTPSLKPIVVGSNIRKGFAPCRRPPLSENALCKSYVMRPGRRRETVSELHARPIRNRQDQLFIRGVTTPCDW